MVNSTDIKGGAARAAYRLHKGLIDQGINSKMLVQRKYSDDPSVEVCHSNSKVGLAYSIFRSNVGSLINKLQYSTNPTIHSSNFLPSGLHIKINNSDVDIVHMHWINKEMISVREISKIKKPIVWTFHDMWAFSGAEHYDDLNSPERYREGYDSNNRPDNYGGLDIDRWTWKRKMKHWSNKEFNIVTPSNWLADCVPQSPIFQDQDVDVIHNGLDLEVYKPIFKSWARDILNIPKSKGEKYIIFGALSATRDKRKGFQQLQKALSVLKDKDYQLLVFGSEGYENIGFGLPTTYLGKLNDDETLALAYSAADVMVVPSLQDNLPNTAVESIACGTPTAAFNIGGLSDIVDHKENGYLAEPYDPMDLAKGINWILEDRERNRVLRENARRKAEEEFSIGVVVQEYLELYKSICRKN